LDDLKVLVRPGNFRFDDGKIGFGVKDIIDEIRHPELCTERDDFDDVGITVAGRTQGFKVALGDFAASR
jgi:hypothetical protein